MEGRIWGLGRISGMSEEANQARKYFIRFRRSNWRDREDWATT